MERQEEIQKEIEECVDDMDKMGELIDELNTLSTSTLNMDFKLVDKKIDKMMPNLGFKKDDNDRLVSLLLNYLKLILIK